MISRLNGIVIDVETGGFDEHETALLSVAFVRVVDGIAVDGIEIRIAPAAGLRIEPAAAAVNGYDPETWGGIDELEALRQLCDWLSDTTWPSSTTWIGLNVPFDRRFLAAAERRQGRGAFVTGQFDHRDIDVRGLAVIPLLAGEVERTSLDALCAAFSVRRSSPHQALADCYSTLLVLQCLLDRIVWT